MRSKKPILIEVLLVGGLGLAFALAANSLSPRGLRIARDYFPAPVGATNAPSPLDAGASAVPPAVVGTGGTPGPAQDALTLRLQQRGLQLVRSNEVIELFRDPRREQGLVVFVDARDETHFASGHIPGARTFHHYRPEAYLPLILPACLSAWRVVVYCNGGECEDSEFAAVMLRDAGVSAESLRVYAGGIVEWKALGMPLETGAAGGPATGLGPAP